MQDWLDAGLLLVFLVSLLLVMWRILASSRVLDCSKPPGTTSVRDWTVLPPPPTGQGAHVNLIQADSRRTVCLQISGTTL